MKKQFKIIVFILINQIVHSYASPYCLSLKNRIRLHQTYANKLINNNSSISQNQINSLYSFLSDTNEIQYYESTDPILVQYLKLSLLVKSYIDNPRDYDRINNDIDSQLKTINSLPHYKSEEYFLQDIIFRLNLFKFFLIKSYNIDNEVMAINLCDSIRSVPNYYPNKHLTDLYKNYKEDITDQDNPYNKYYSPAINNYIKYFEHPDTLTYYKNAQDYFQKYRTAVQDSTSCSTAILRTDSQLRQILLKDKKGDLINEVDKTINNFKNDLNSDVLKYKFRSNPKDYLFYKEIINKDISALEKRYLSSSEIYKEVATKLSQYLPNINPAWKYLDELYKNGQLQRPNTDIENEILHIYYILDYFVKGTDPRNEIRTATNTVKNLETLKIKINETDFQYDNLLYSISRISNKIPGDTLSTAYMNQLKKKGYLVAFFRDAINNSNYPLFKLLYQTITDESKYHKLNELSQPYYKNIIEDHYHKYNPDGNTAIIYIEGLGQKEINSDYLVSINDLLSDDKRHVFLYDTFEFSDSINIQVIEENLDQIKDRFHPPRKMNRKDLITLLANIDLPLTVVDFDFKESPILTQNDSIKIIQDTLFHVRRHGGNNSFLLDSLRWSFNGPGDDSTDTFTVYPLDEELKRQYKATEFKHQYASHPRNRCIELKPNLEAKKTKSKSYPKEIKIPFSLNVSDETLILSSTNGCYFLDKNTYQKTTQPLHSGKFIFAVCSSNTKGQFHYADFMNDMTLSLGKSIKPLSLINISDTILALCQTHPAQIKGFTQNDTVTVKIDDGTLNSLYYPEDMCFDPQEGALYISFPADNEIRKYKLIRNSDNSITLRNEDWDFITPKFEQPYKLECMHLLNDMTRNYIVVLGGDQHIRIYRPDGFEILDIKPNEICTDKETFFVDIATDSTNTIYVLDKKNHKIHQVEISAPPVK